MAELKLTAADTAITRSQAAEPYRSQSVAPLKYLSSQAGEVAEPMPGVAAVLVASNTFLVQSRQVHGQWS